MISREEAGIFGLFRFRLTSTNLFWANNLEPPASKRAGRFDGRPANWKVGGQDYETGHARGAFGGSDDIQPEPRHTGSSTRSRRLVPLASPQELGREQMEPVRQQHVLRQPVLRAGRQSLAVAAYSLRPLLGPAAGNGTTPKGHLFDWRILYEAE